MSKIKDIMNSIYNENISNKTGEDEWVRFNVYDKNGKLIGQDYQRDNGDWMHKWVDKTGKFERGSSRGRCADTNSDGSSKTWTYKKV